MRFSKVFSVLIVVAAILFFAGCSDTGVSPVSAEVEGYGTFKASIRLPEPENLAKRSALAKSQLVPLPQVTAYAYDLRSNSETWDFDTIPVSFTGDTTFDFEISDIPIGVYRFMFYTIGDHPEGTGQTRIHYVYEQDFEITDGDTVTLDLQATTGWHSVICKLPPPLPSEVAAVAVDINNLDEFDDAYDSTSFTPGDYATDTLKVGAPVSMGYYDHNYRITLNLYDSNNDLCYTGFKEMIISPSQDYYFTLTLEEITSGAQGMFKATVQCLPGYRTDIDIIYP